jgi:hypothetical protein
MILFDLLRKINRELVLCDNPRCRKMLAQPGAATQPRLEELEERLTPTNYNTITSAAISIAPNFAARTATETITATVTNLNSNGPPITAGNIGVNVNNTVVAGGPLNSSGQASVTITLPSVAVAVPQTLQVYYGGATVGSNTFNSSAFFSPVYLNVLNEFLNANVTFVGPYYSQQSLPIGPYGSYNGETDTINFFNIQFNYVDPGTIETFSILGIGFPGSFAARLFGPIESFASTANAQLL